MESHSNNLKQWLPMMLKCNNLTVVDFCKKLKVTRALYYQYLNDASRPSKVMLRNIANVLECSEKEVAEQVQPRKRFYSRSQIQSHLLEK